MRLGSTLAIERPLGALAECGLGSAEPLPPPDLAGELAKRGRLAAEAPARVTKGHLYRAARGATMTALERPLDSQTTAASAAAALGATELAMDRYARGDSAAFEVVYDNVAPRIFSYLLRQTRDVARAEDLTQLTLLQLHRHRASYISGAAVLPWAFAIARRLFIDEFRRRKVDVLWNARVVDEHDGLTPALPDQEVETRQVAALVESQLERIPAAQRVAYELLRVEGLSHQQAAERLGTSVNSVKLRAFRAYAALRTAIFGGATSAYAAAPGAAEELEEGEDS